MRPDPGGHYSQQVDDWIRRNASGLSSERLLLLFGDAIDAIQKRAATTLSEVTLAPIFDRVLIRSQKNFPLLSKMKIEASGVCLDALMAQPGDSKPDEVTEAFRFFLVELLTLLGTLTADILTKPLCQELFKVTPERARQANQQGLKSVKSGSDRRDT